MSDKLTQNLTEATVVDTANDRVPIYSEASASELRCMKPDNLIPDASATVKGKVELATDAETITGTDTVRAITPSNYRNSFDDTLPAVVNAATSKTTPVDADEIPLVDSAASWVLKKLSFLNFKLAIMSALNPVGTIREFNVLTNPATLLGFGTWSAFGTGRVTIAIDAGQTEFDTNGETGGAKTHSHTVASHHHSISTDGAHAHSPQAGSTGWSSGGTPMTSNGGHNHGGNTGDTSPSTDSISNLPPYIVVYRWVRTA